MIAKSNSRILFGALALAILHCRAELVFAAPGLGLPETPRAKLEYVKKNMYKVQAAAERYAGHHQGRYPVKIDRAFQSYFPFGSADDVNFSTLSCNYNPYTNTKEMPVLGTLKSFAEARRSVTQKIGIGVTEYNPIENGKGYIIRGGAEKGEIVTVGTTGRESKTPLLLTNNPRLAVLANMMAVQFAAESYYEKFGKFPLKLDEEFKSCFPNHPPGQQAASVREQKGIDSPLPTASDLQKQPISGLPLRNPYTRNLEWPVLGRFKTVKEARFTPPGGLKPGIIEYNPIDGGKDYAIRAGGPDGKAFIRHKNDQQTFTLSKQGEL